MKSVYYELRGWDVESRSPTRCILKELGLDEVADSLAGQGLVRKGRFSYEGNRYRLLKGG